MRGTPDDPDDLVGLLDHAASRWPDREAWVFDETGQRFTFAEVAAHTDAFATALAGLGVGRGDRVAVMLRNRPEFPLLWLALARLGAVLVPVNTRYRELDGEHVLAHSGARLAVTTDEFRDLLESIAPATAVERVLTVDDLATGTETAGTGTVGTATGAPSGGTGELPANIQYTSGTTGAPKGCVLPQRYWTTLARGLVTDFPHIGADDTVLTAQPFHYIDPQWNVALGLYSGARLVVLDGFHPSTFWHRVREYGVTWFYCLGLMPTLLLRMPPEPDDTRHRVRAVSASAIPAELHAELERRWGVPWYEAFGMTETGSDLRMPPDEHDDFVGTGCLGRPAPGREVMVADGHGRPVPRGEQGELLLRGVGMMHGYHDAPEATARAFHGGWFRTGDLATMDADGRVFFVGRTKDMIRRSGENIAAEEVERALLRHPGVRAAAVVGVDDELRGEEVKAWVVPATGTGTGPRGADAANTGETTPDPAELAAFCAGKLAAFKVPRYWAVVDSLPMTDSERVAKGALRTDDGDPVAGCYDSREGRWR
ncbi:AMP-binding protein [Saccharomonospora iraqiensis]|uniref:AMP-binding protein n=1 Tax=Saccharomonospora iraqiensis TaxID=52698 RepID=UPI0004277A95|nr:AMP-binding protein [Saccharomonospora iraqiensis]